MREKLTVRDYGWKDGDGEREALEGPRELEEGRRRRRKMRRMMKRRQKGTRLLYVHGGKGDCEIPRKKRNAVKTSVE